MQPSLLTRYAFQLCLGPKKHLDGTFLTALPPHEQPSNPPFDPASSTTAIAPPCTGQYCMAFTQALSSEAAGCSAVNIPNYVPTNLTGDPSNECQYYYRYGGGYYTSGLLVEDNIHLTSSSGENISSLVTRGCAELLPYPFFSSWTMLRREFFFVHCHNLPSCSFSQLVPLIMTLAGVEGTKLDF